MSDPGRAGPDDAYRATRWARYEPRGPSRRRPADVEIRTARVVDCMAIAAIEGSRDGAVVASAQRRCEAQAADPASLLLVALTGGQIVGFARAGKLKRPVDAPADHVPDGWYLLGLVVVDAWRRRGIGEQLTRRRLAWIAERADAAYYFANARNRASLDLHAALGFVEVSHRFSAPRVQFAGGEGVLSRLDLR